MTDHDIARWADDGGYIPPDPDEPAGHGPPKLKPFYGWYLTYSMLRRLFA